jgi:hypothetical protein
MKATLTFDLPEEQEEFDLASNAGRYRTSLWEVSQEIFRPARKHGYRQGEIATLLDQLDQLVATHAETIPSWPKDEYGVLTATDLISLLEKEFFRILDENNVEL